MASLLLNVLLIFCFLISCGFALKDSKYIWATSLILFASLNLWVYGLEFSDVFRTGEPIENIAQGSYPVSAIVVDGKDVNLLISFPGYAEGKGNLRFYQFKIDAFSGGIKPDADKLIVVEAGKFKKLMLE